MSNPRTKTKGFALVLTLSLLALLVLVVWALGGLVRIGTRAASSSSAQMQARQNALLSLSVALGDLQRTAGPDDRVTGMAGIAGVQSTATATTRYWTGVWTGTGQFLGWMASGAGTQPTAPLNAVELIGNGTVGAASASANLEKQHQVAGLIEIQAPASGSAVQSAGRIAYLIVDEGVKIGAYANPSRRVVANLIPRIGSSMLTNQLRLKTAIESSSVLDRSLSYEQLGELASTVTPSVLQDCFHYVSHTPTFLVGAAYRSGALNVNTVSPLVWRSMLDTYNAAPGAVVLSTVTARGNALASGFSAYTATKSLNGPFTSVVAFSTYFQSTFPSSSSPSANQILAVLQPLLAVRSDTFRIRAYGDVLNPADGTVVESSAICEAIVQRSPEVIDSISGPWGRRFVITYFRWLGPDDI